MPLIQLYNTELFWSMDLNFLSQLTPELRNALLKLQNININENEVQEDAELEEIAMQIVESETDGKKSTIKKLNIGSVLSNLERGLYKANLPLDDVNIIGLESKGLPSGAKSALSIKMIDQLVNLGILEYDGKNILNFDTELASKILDTEVTDWNDFTKKFCENSYSYVEDLQQFSDANLKKYFIGPLLQYASEEKAKENKYNDLRYALNFNAILEDFAHYPGWIETPEDLLSAIQWKSTQGIGVNGAIDEDIQQGYIGDCWLLSGILALASSKDGAKAISDAIKIQTQPDGTQVVVVEFKGALDSEGKPAQITITAEDIAKYDSNFGGIELLSNGDNDMLVMELAMNKLEEMLRSGDVVTSPELAVILSTPDQFDYRAFSPDYINSFLEGSDASRMIYMLTGAIPDLYFDELTRNNIYQILQNAAENPGTVMSFGLLTGNHTAKTMNGGTFSFNLDEGGHAFAVTDVQKVLDVNGNVDYDNSTVTFVNPWDSSEKITVSWKEFVNLDIGTMSSTSLNKQIDGTTDKPDTPSPFEDKSAYSDNHRIQLIASDFTDGNLTLKQLMSLLVDIDSVEDIQVKHKETDTVVTIVYDGGKELTVSCNTKAVNDGLEGNNGKSLHAANSAEDIENQTPLSNQRRYIWLDKTQDDV